MRRPAAGGAVRGEVVEITILYTVGGEALLNIRIT